MTTRGALIGNLCYLAGRLFSTQNLEEAENTLSAAFAISRKMLLAEKPDTIKEILEDVVGMRHDHYHEIALRILRQLSATSKELLGESHPLCLFTAWLAAMPWSQVKAIFSRCLDVMIEDFESLLGPMHWSTLECRLTLSSIENDLAILRRLLNKCESALESYDERTLTVRAGLMFCTWRKGDYAEAKKMGEDLLAFLRTTDAILNSIWFQLICYETIAYCHHDLGELDQAIANLQAAIDLRMTYHGSQHGGLGDDLFTLERWYIEQGDLVAAMMARDQRISVLESIERAQQDLSVWEEHS